MGLSFREIFEESTNVGCNTKIWAFFCGSLILSPPARPDRTVADRKRPAGDCPYIWRRDKDEKITEASIFAMSLMVEAAVDRFTIIEISREKFIDNADVDGSGTESQARKGRMRQKRTRSGVARANSNE